MTLYRDFGAEKDMRSLSYLDLNLIEKVDVSQAIPPNPQRGEESWRFGRKALCLRKIRGKNPLMKY